MLLKMAMFPHSSRGAQIETLSLPQKSNQSMATTNVLMLLYMEQRDTPLARRLPVKIHFHQVLFDLEFIYLVKKFIKI